MKKDKKQSMKKNCKLCNNLFIATGNNHKYCKNCCLLNNKEKTKIYNQKYRKEHKNPNPKHKFWTKQEEKYLKENYEWGNKKEILSYLKRSWYSINHHAKFLKICRFRRNSKIKNILGNNFSFRINNPGGHVRISNPSLGVYNQLAHRYIWEKYYNKKIPKDCYIHHKDGNPQNNNIENLTLVKITEHFNVEAIRRIAQECFEIADAHGFWKRKNGKPYRNVGEALCLIVSEVSEAFESYRKNPKDKEHFVEELADVLIRLLDFSYGMGLHIENALRKKMEINKKRPYKHGKRF